jgi:hypothetical protein
MPKRHSAAETPPPGSKPTAWAKYRAVHRATRQEARASCDWRKRELSWSAVCRQGTHRRRWATVDLETSRRRDVPPSVQTRWKVLIHAMHQPG